MEIPGISASHTIISDTCRENRSDANAFDDAMARMRREYDALCRVWPVGKGAKFHVVLSLELDPPKLSPVVSGASSSRLTTDPDDPRLKRGVDHEDTPQNEVYLVLSEEERAKGFVRSVRRSYTHVGVRPKHTTRDLTEEEKRDHHHPHPNYVKFEIYPASEAPVTGRYWTQSQLESGCGSVTTMGQSLAETYARDPKFYGSTYCCHCFRHLPVEEFVWTGTEERVGS